MLGIRIRAKADHTKRTTCRTEKKPSGTVTVNKRIYQVNIILFSPRFIEQQRTKSRLITIVSFRTNLPKNLFRIRHLHPFPYNKMIVGHFKNRHISPPSFIRYLSPVAIFSCDILPHSKRNIIPQIIFCDILKPFHKPVIKSRI